MGGAYDAAVALVDDFDRGYAAAPGCVDSLQFAPDHDTAVREAYRILRPGGRYVQTNWQPVDPAHPGVPDPFRGLRFADLLGRAGFTCVVVEERPDLAERERQVFLAALDAGPAQHDKPLQRLQEEARLVLGWPDTVRRVLVIAERP